jgi:low affinity Fe/Cu permease
MATHQSSALDAPRIAHRTKNLPWGSRLLHRIDHATGLPSVGIVIALSLAVLFLVGVCVHFASWWVVGFEAGVSAVTLIMVLAIQHTQSREQAATQRKLDELLRALPQANNEFMMLEEASAEVLQDMERSQRRDSARTRTR